MSQDKPSKPELHLYVKTVERLYGLQNADTCNDLIADWLTLYAAREKAALGDALYKAIVMAYAALPDKVSRAESGLANAINAWDNGIAELSKKEQSK